MLATSCAPGGIGKLPTGASTRTVAGGRGLTGAALGRDAVGEGAARLAAGERDVAGVTVVIPAGHAATDRLAAQVITPAARWRYAVIGCPSVGLVVPVQS